MNTQLYNSGFNFSNTCREWGLYRGQRQSCGRVWFSQHFIYEREAFIWKHRRKWARGPASNLPLYPLKITSVNRNIWNTNTPADCCIQTLTWCPSGKDFLEKWNETTGPCFSISLHLTHFCTFANQYTHRKSALRRSGSFCNSNWSILQTPWPLTCTKIYLFKVFPPSGLLRKRELCRGKAIWLWFGVGFGPRVDALYANELFIWRLQDDSFENSVRVSTITYKQLTSTTEIQ